MIDVCAIIQYVNTKAKIYRPSYLSRIKCTMFSCLERIEPMTILQFIWFPSQLSKATVSHLQATASFYTWSFSLNIFLCAVSEAEVQQKQCFKEASCFYHSKFHRGQFKTVAENWLVPHCRMVANGIFLTKGDNIQRIYQYSIYLQCTCI